MALSHIHPQFSLSSQTHFVNIRYKPTDHMNGDFALLRTMRNQLASRAAIITLKSPMAAKQALIVSIKVVGTFDNETEVINAAEHIVRQWQRENDGRGRFPFDRRQIWQQYLYEKPGRYKAPSRRLSRTVTIVADSSTARLGSFQHSKMSTARSHSSSDGYRSIGLGEFEQFCTEEGECPAKNAATIPDVTTEEQLDDGIDSLLLGGRVRTTARRFDLLDEIAERGASHSHL